MKTEALPAIRAKLGNTFIFQQDNAPAHRAKATKEFLKQSDVKVLEWPAQSPDLNPIEQVWLWMAKDINTKSFDNIQEMEDYVLDLWEKLPKEHILSYIRKLSDKMLYISTHDGELYKDHN